MRSSKIWLGNAIAVIWVMAFDHMAFASWTPAMSAATDRWDAILAKYVNHRGGVDYIRLQAEGRADLKSFLGAYATFDPRPLTDDEKKALYINFYNAGMLLNILRWTEDESVPPKSRQFLEQRVNDIRIPGGDIWEGRYTFSLNGIQVNLNQIEHGLIRGEADGELGKFKVKVLDPRIHAAVNCAAISCPRLREIAYRPETVSKMLDVNMREWLGSTEQFRKLTPETMRANKIVYWYYQDFDETARARFGLKGAGDYLAQFVPKDAVDSAWMKKHWRDHFNNRSTIFLWAFSSDFEFHYDWHIADTREKK